VPQKRVTSPSSSRKSPSLRTRGGQRSRGSRETLRLLLEAVAPSLLRDGVTAQQIYDLAKDALIKSAAANARMASGKINQSKIAAATGLTRPEIRRRLERSGNPQTVDVRALDRSTRVIEGWLRDPMFLDEKGKPRDLSLRNQSCGFPALVRRHSGDIPPRAVLAVLQAKQLVAVHDQRVRVRASKRSLAESSKNALPEVAPYIVDTIRLASRPAANLKYATKARLFAESPKDELLLTETVVTAIASAIATLAAPDGQSERAKPSQGTRQLSIGVTLIASSADEKLSARTSS
jgi:hypothetical protein